jgi:glycosyltransferase involved in cell wall biosynthesis
MNATEYKGNLVIELITGLGLGGAERLAVEMSREIEKRDIDIYLISLTKDTRILSQYPSIEKITKVLDMRMNPIYFMRALYELKSLVASHRNVVVHAHMVHALVAAVMLKLLRPSVSIVFTSHSFGGFTLIRKLFIKLTRRFRASDIIFSMNQHVEMNAYDTHVIPNFAPRIVSSETEQLLAYDCTAPIVFAFIGRMVPSKNPIAIVQAFKSLLPTVAQLLMVGDGPLLDDVRDFVVRNGLQSRVEVLGPRNDICDILNGVDVLVMASEWEGLPMIILEAGARGVAVIAPPVGAIPELLSDGCGYICEVLNLELKMQQVCDNLNDAVAVGLRLKEKIEKNYSIDLAVDKHLQIYRNSGTWCNES